MDLVGLRRAAAAALIIAGAALAPAPPVAGAAAGPTVLAVHRSGAVDVPGNSTLGTVAKLSVPAGNWSITATATIQGTAPPQSG